ncbi:Peroxisome biosynthesis protein pex1 [Puccinia graminis f. sp. tritici]|uniref:Peroxisomal ATPase PEX1 n=2 Tax=Puccinia graminis f. sp. tritici TaxID=56615 RepID=A0A5B0R148_PUCGR|nr:Peroxisome biosynthesis protein pex1 [Puccinia graminis f. sp. tritici]
MTRQVNLRPCNLRTSLVNLPPILSSQLSSQGILPQTVGIELRQIGRSSSKESDRPLYVGWSGLTASLNNERFSKSRSSAQRQNPGLWGSSTLKNGLEFIESLELDEALASEMGWKQNDRLSIKFHHHGMTHATTVNVEPLTIDDWEILESNPQYLEENILKQIRVLVESQKLLIWVYDKTLVQVKVTSVLPPSSNSKTDRPAAPYLITNETEIIVSPKTRFDPSVQDSAQKNQILGDAKGVDTTTSKERNPLTKKIDFKILPQAFSLVLGTEDSAEPTPAPGTTSKKPNQSNVIDDCPIVALNPMQFSQVERIFPTTLCSLGLLVRPNQASSSKQTTTSTAPATVPPDLSIRHGPNKNSKISKKPEAKPAFPIPNIADRVRLTPHSGVPVGFIYLPVKFRQKWFSSLAVGLDPRSSFRLDQAGDYEYVRIGPSKDASSDMSQSDSNEPNLPDNQQSTRNKSEEILLLGFSDHLDFCEQYLQNTLAAAHLFTLGNYRTGNHNLAGLMIRGSSGSGKTSLVKTLIERVYLDPNAMMYCRYIDCGKHVDDRLNVLKSNFTEWFDDAAWHSPSVLVLDDLDQLLPAEPEHIDSFRYRHLAEEFLSIAKAATKDKLVILVSTCSSSVSIHNLLRSETHIFSEVLELKGLSRTSRREILTELIEIKAAKSGLDISRIKPDTLSSEKTEGYLPSDLKDLVDRAVHQAIIRSLRTTPREPSKPISLELSDFESAQSGFVPISLRDVKLQKSTVNWSDIGGLVETRRILRETLEWPTKYPSIFANCPLRLRSGLLLYGYPGCGKTLLASAIAKECGLNFINIKGPELLNKYIGASEQSVRELFDRAQVAKPCVLFFDEFESIAPKRGHDSTGVTDRVVNQLLTQMDGAEGLEGVYVLAATSRPDLIDPALLRPGRLDKSLLCSMPKVEERLDILKAVSRALPLDGDLCFEEVAELTEGFTGADLQALIYSAHLEVVHESINAKTKSIEGKHHEGYQNKNQSHKLRWTEIQPQQPGLLKTTEGAVRSLAEKEAIRKRLEEVLENTTADKTLAGESGHKDIPTQSPSLNLIEMRHVRSALRNARPSVPAKELARLSKIYQSFVSSRSDGGLPGGEASEEIGGRASLM